MNILKIAATVIAVSAMPSFTAAGVSITDTGSSICIRSDGLPNHATGNFPNRGNPHSIRSQNIRVCVDANPQKLAVAREIDRGAIGIGLNGVMFRPEAADYWDPNSRRGFSRRNTGWRLEPMGPRNIFGLDSNNAHVDRRGLYHYHGKPEGLLAYAKGSHIGYSADGFEIHYVGGDVTSGWRLKSGRRPNGPGGRYDGTYVQDYEYVGGSGALDRCNGGFLNGKYVYFLTDHFPFYPRCLWGNIASGFR
ncbi:MAG: YHYH protein [Pseudomonadota bacterium]